MSGQYIEGTACLKCRRLCDGEEYVALKDGTTFHRFCFTCDICQNELPLKFALKNGRYYHTECYADAKASSPKCTKCEGPILAADVSVVLRNDVRFHSRCFKCDACSKLLSERFYSTMKLYYHEECVACCMCNTKLFGKNFSQLQEGGYICDGCLYRTQNGSANQAPAPQYQQAPLQQNQQQYQQLSQLPPPPQKQQQQYQSSRGNSVPSTTPMSTYQQQYAAPPALANGPSYEEAWVPSSQQLPMARPANNYGSPARSPSGSANSSSNNLNANSSSNSQNRFPPPPLAPKPGASLPPKPTFGSQPNLSGSNSGSQSNLSGGQRGAPQQPGFRFYG